MATIHYQLDGRLHAERCETEGDVGYLVELCRWGAECGIVAWFYLERD